MIRRPRTSSRRATPASQQGGGWTFLSNHAHVLICLARSPELTLREVAAAVGVTERAVQKIVADLERAHVISRVRSGRRNRYTIHANQPLRHPVESHHTLAELLKALAD